VRAHVLAGGPGVPVTPPGTLIGACDSSNPGIACRLAWDDLRHRGGHDPRRHGVQPGAGAGQPLRQWEVQRELTERLKNSLDATGADAGPDPGAESDASGAHSFDCPPSPATAGAVLGDASAPQPGPPAASEVSHPGHVT